MREHGASPAFEEQAMKTHHRFVLASASLVAIAPLSRAVQAGVYPPGSDAPPFWAWQSLAWTAAAALVAGALLWKHSRDSEAAMVQVRVRRGND